MRKTLIGICTAAMIATAPMAGVVGVSGCTTTQTAAASLTASRALYTAELAYNGFAQAARVAVTSPTLSDAQKARIRGIDARAYTALLAARAGRASAQTVINILEEGADQ